MFTFCYSNINGLLSKKRAVSAFLRKSKIPVLVIAETKLDSSIPDCDLCLDDDYTIFRKDRALGGGGLAFIVRNNFSISICPENTSTRKEVFAIDFLLRGRTIRLVSVYWPPGHDDYAVDIFVDIKSFICKSVDVCVIGDFNLPKVRWSNYYCSVRLQNEFLSSMYECGFRQYINAPTRFNPPNILDLVWLQNRNFTENFQEFPWY